MPLLMLPSALSCRRAVRADAVEAALPRALPGAIRTAPRSRLRRQLGGPDGRVLRAGADERLVDGGRRGGRVRRESGTVWTAARASGRAGADDSGLDRYRVAIYPPDR